MKRPLLFSLLAPALACALAAPAWAQYDPANVDAMASPQAQQQMRQSAQAVAEAMVGRSANATDRRVLDQYMSQQNALARQLQSAARAGAGALPAGYGAAPAYVEPGDEGYASLPHDSRDGELSPSELQALTRLAQTPEGRRVMQQLSQQGYDVGNRGGAYGYGSGPAQKPGRVLGQAFLLDLLNAAHNSALRPKVIYKDGTRP